MSKYTHPIPSQSANGGHRLAPSTYHHSGFLCPRSPWPVPRPASVAPWSLGGGGQSGDGDNRSGGDSDARGRIAKAGRCYGGV